MGNKRITEKDFWICTNGAVPAQLQSGNTTTKKISGEKYITIQDKATSSWIDFGCTKLMLIYALLAAAIVVVGAMIIGTGGAALIAIGAIAGLAGAAWGAVVGTLLCGHQGAKIRDWIPVPKSQRTYVQGVEQLTGDYQMTCKIPGGMITFAPQIKSWSQAISLGASNYLGKLMEGMMAGAAIGMGGAAISGGAAAFSAGGARGLAQGAWQFARSMPKNFYVNAIESVSKFGLALRGVMGVQNTAATYGNTGEASGWDFVKGTVAMETGAYDSFQNIRTGKGTWQDYVGIAMMFAPVGQGKRDLEASLRNEPEGTARDTETSKADETETTTRDEEGSTRAEAQDGANPNEGKIGDAFEDLNSNKPVKKPRSSKPKAGSPEHKTAAWEAYQNNPKVKVKKSYEEWSNRYDANMKNPGKGNKSADDHHKSIGWGEREVRMKIDENGNPIEVKKGQEKRNLDIGDVKNKKAVEVKDYSSKKVPNSKEIKREVEFDKKLVEKGWDVEWVFKDKGPSKGLEEALKSPPPIKITIIK